MFMRPGNIKVTLKIESVMRRIVLINWKGKMKREKSILVLIGCTAFFPAVASAQDTCGNAVYQLQSYAQQVNYMANTEYQGIVWRCGGNPTCMNMSLPPLNAWYLQQSSFVQSTYNQIVMQCAGGQGGSRIPIQRPTAQRPGKIDDNVIEDLTVDNEDKSVRIIIPSTPQGFR